MCFQAIDTGRATRQIARKWVARSVCLQIFRDGRGCGSPTPVAPLCASKEELSHLGLPVEWLLVESQGVASRRVAHGPHLLHFTIGCEEP